MSAYARSITVRDENLVGYLMSQGQATAEQLIGRFFPSAQAFYKRVATLQQLGVVESAPIVGCAKTTPSGVSGLMRALQAKRGSLAHKKVYRLAEDIRAQFLVSNEDLSKDGMLKHQILLDGPRKAIETILIDEIQVVLNDPEIRIQEQRRLYKTVLVPDLIFKCKRGDIAVELERTDKSEAELMLKFAQYRDSQYLKVVYFCEGVRVFDRVRKIASHFNNIAVSGLWDVNKVIVSGEFSSLTEYLGKK